jgi:endoglucanase
MASVLYALSLIYKEELPCKVSVLFSCCEEIHGVGAKTGCYAINPDIALAVDTSFAGDGTQGTGKMGEGAMIGFSPSLSRKLSHDLAYIASEKNIPYQYEVMKGRTGTNADDFSVCREGVKTCTVSIPLYYMHTPVEVIDLNDIKYTGKLIAEYLRRCTEC